jgi:hypothetical protein
MKAKSFSEPWVFTHSHSLRDLQLICTRLICPSDQSALQRCWLSFWLAEHRQQSMQFERFRSCVLCLSASISQALLLLAVPVAFGSLMQRDLKVAKGTVFDKVEGFTLQKTKGAGLC